MVLLGAQVDLMGTLDPVGAPDALERERLPSRSAAVGNGAGAAPKAKKLSGKEQKELETLPAKIEALEQEQAQLTARLADPAFYKKEPQKFAEVKGRLDVLEREHAVAFSRWEELEALRGKE